MLPERRADARILDEIRLVFLVSFLLLLYRDMSEEREEKIEKRGADTNRMDVDDDDQELLQKTSSDPSQTPKGDRKEKGKKRKR
jgi:hypothetical protein